MSTITLRYYAAAAEAAGCEQEQLAFDADITLLDLKNSLVERYGPSMGKVLKGGSFLIDGRVRRDDGLINGDSVDVLPPFAGG